MKNLSYIILILFLGGWMMSCEQDPLSSPPPEDTIPTPADPDPGNIDFTKVVTIGNSLTAGFQSNAFFQSTQDNSLGAILNRQFALAGASTTFNQPDINHPVGFSGESNGIIFGRLRLQGDPPTPTPQLSDASAIPSPLNPAFDYTGPTNELNNFAVPGIILGQLFIPDTGDWSQFGMNPAVNPFYARFASDPGTSTILGDVMSTNPTFFVSWIGNNDVLGYAASGGSGAVPITDPGDFAAQYTGLLQTLTTNPVTRGVVANIPNVDFLPFFNLVPWNSITLDAATAAVANAGFMEYNAGLQALAMGGVISQEEADRRTIEFGENVPSGVVIDDETLTDITAFLPPEAAIYAQARQTTPDDLLTLTAASILGTTVGGDPTLIIGVSVPAEDGLVLIPEEIQEIEDAIMAFNSAIEGAVSTLGLGDRVAVADVNGAFADFVATGGAVVDGVTMTPELAPPYGIFSEDGVHPNTRGYAYSASFIIDAINEKWSSEGINIPQVSVADYPGTDLPIP